MKTKIFLAAAAAAAVLAGCDKNQNPVTVSHDVGETSKLSVCIPLDGRTRAAGTVDVAEEDKLNSAQVYVFSESGILESYKNSDTGNVDLVCTRGEKTVVAMVNAPSASDISTLSGLRMRATSLSDNKAGSFVMYGEKSLSVDAASLSVTMEVRRYAAKVVIQKITNKMSLAQYQSSPIEVTGIYLINVASSVAIAGASAPASWANRQKNEATSNCHYYEKPSSLKIRYNSSETNPHYFYCYFNPTVEDSDAEEWSLRHTRLVVETLISGRTYYYPITLPPIVANTVYTIGELTITRLGPTTPDVIGVIGDVSYTISVAPWETTEVDPVTI